tara:strand:- start:15929 stop:16402 length:474 start_codon:yes stop_codon:yes gene_type:complete
MDYLYYIGLEKDKSHHIAEKLNALLANYQVFYLNARGFHWNIKGDKFFELHAKFEELYTDLLGKIDEIAERVLTLGKHPLHSFSDYVEVAQISEHKNVQDEETSVRIILESFRILLAQERELLVLSEQAMDEGTNSLMSDYIREQEKLVWMYAAFLG